MATIPEIGIIERLAPLYYSEAPFIIAYGGRSGGKSKSIAQRLVINALGYKFINTPKGITVTKDTLHSKHRILCTREIQKSLEESVYSDILQTIDSLGVRQCFKATQNKIISYNGSEFLFHGLQNHTVHSIKSYSDVSICWVEEAEYVSAYSWQILKPTIRAAHSQMIISFNPESPKSATYQDYIETESDRFEKIFVNYTDNPFLSEKAREDIKEARNQLPEELFNQIYLGVPLDQSNSLVFKNKFEIKEFDITESKRYWFGADWGFAEDPTVLIRCFEHGSNLYIDDEVYEYNLPLDEIPKAFSRIRGSRSNVVYADSSRPETIEFLNRKYRFNLEPSIKGAGSVMDGIELLKKYDKIIIHPRCVNTSEEFFNYRFDLTRFGDIKPKPVDKYNHAIDALRYAVMGNLKTKKPIYSSEFFNSLIALSRRPYDRGI